MRSERLRLYAPSIGADGDVMAYGHYGRPLLVFPSEQGSAHDYEDQGMVGALAPLIDAGRTKLYCVDSYDAASWNADLPLEERAQRHDLFQSWIVDQVVPYIHHDCGGTLEIIVTGCSLGAYHAANMCLKRPDLFPLAICQSGVYDISHIGWGRKGDAAYFNNPMDYVGKMEGDHLGWIRSRVSLLLIAGQGMWEDTTGALESTKAFARTLAEKGIKHELDLWGHDMPHDWPSWRLQIAHHLPRFV